MTLPNIDFFSMFRYFKLQLKSRLNGIRAYAESRDYVRGDLIYTKDSVSNIAPCCIV